MLLLLLILGIFLPFDQKILILRSFFFLIFHAPHLTFLKTLNVTGHIPTAATVFPREIVPAPRAWSEKIYTNIHRWTEAERGGHFAAFEQPEIFVREVRDAFRAFR